MYVTPLTVTESMLVHPPMMYTLPVRKQQQTTFTTGNGASTVFSHRDCAFLQTLDVLKFPHKKRLPHSTSWISMT